MKKKEHNSNKNIKCTHACAFSELIRRAKKKEDRTASELNVA